MPSPVAHSLAAIAITGVAQHLRSGSHRWPGREATGLTVLIFAMIGAANAPDFDFVPGVLVGHPDWLHRGISHSLAAALAFGALAAMLCRRARVPAPWAIGVLMGLAYASHLVLDMFSPDPLRFNGVPLFWPISDRHFILPAQVFLDIRRDPGADGFLASLWHLHNVRAMAREVLIMAPLILIGRLLARGWPAPAAGSPPLVRPRLDRRIDSES